MVKNKSTEVKKIKNKILTKGLIVDIIYFVDDGAGLSLVEYLAWDQGVAGSNPAAPTINRACSSVG